MSQSEGRREYPLATHPVTQEPPWTGGRPCFGLNMRIECRMYNGTGATWVMLRMFFSMSQSKGRRG
jgi:hypothetical protein